MTQIKEAIFFGTEVKIERDPMALTFLANTQKKENSKGFVLYNQRIPNPMLADPDPADSDIGTYVRRLAVFRDANAELDGIELSLLATPITKPILHSEDLKQSGVIGYDARLFAMFEAMVHEALDQFVTPTHVVKIIDEGGIREVWAALDRADLIEFVNTDGKKAIGSTGPIVTCDVLTDEGVKAILELQSKLPDLTQYVKEIKEST
jgi:hypothetical protein